MHNGGVGFGWVQEPYAINDRVGEFSGQFGVFADLGGKAAVVVTDNTVECALMFADEYGVCVAIDGKLGRFHPGSLYCKYVESLEVHLECKDAVLRFAKGSPVDLGMDANVLSPQWFSKPTKASGTSAMERGV